MSFRDNEWREFERQLRAELFKHGPYEANFVEGSWKFHGIDHLAGMANLAQYWKHAASGDRELLISQFVRFTLTDPENEAMSQESFREALRLRLFPVEMEKPDEMVTFDICPELVVAIAVDTPNSVASTTYEELSIQNLTAEEAFKIGLDNVSHRESFAFQKLELPTGFDLQCATGESFFVATYALMLHRLPGVDPELEYLFVVPNRHLVAWVQADDKLDERAKFLAGFGRRGFDEGPGSVSPVVFLWSQGQFSRYAVAPEVS